MQPIKVFGSTLFVLTWTVLLLLIQTVKTDLFSAQVDIDKLFLLQDLVTSHLNAYLVQEEIRLQKLRKRIEHSFRSKSKMNNIEVQSDPISNFIVVKRLFVDLDRIVNLAEDRRHFGILKDSIDQLKKSNIFPTETDLTGTIQALARSQETYELDTTELANGFLAGFDCGAQLDVDDCFELGKQSYKANEFSQSINWFTEALKRIDTQENLYDDLEIVLSSDINVLPFSPRTFQTVSEEEIYKYLQWATNFNQTVVSAKGFLAESLGVQLDSIVDEFSKMFESAGGHPKVEESFRNVKLKYEALCRQQIFNTNHSSVASPHKLQCFLRTDLKNPYFILQPLKIELLSTSPEVVIFHDIVSDSEIKFLKELAKPMFETAQVISTSGHSEISKVRTSKSAWIGNDVSPVIARINQRISAATNLDLTTSEDLQIVNYGTSGQYEPHFDFYYGRSPSEISDDESGNRIATLLIYMSDVVAGGATVFPSLNLSVQPSKGAGLFWHNLLHDGNGDFRTRHGACPVLIGSKWVANKWFHERGQEFRQPCQVKHSQIENGQTDLGNHQILF